MSPLAASIPEYAIGMYLHSEEEEEEEDLQITAVLANARWSLLQGGYINHRIEGIP